MPTVRRVWILAPLVVVAGAVALAAAGCGAPDVERHGVVYAISEGGVRYEFNAAWRNEHVWRRNADGEWRREAQPDAAALAALRGRFLDSIGVASLDLIPREAGEELRALRALGYL